MFELFKCHLYYVLSRIFFPFKYGKKKINSLKRNSAGVNNNKRSLVNAQRTEQRS